MAICDPNNTNYSALLAFYTYDPYSEEFENIELIGSLIDGNFTGTSTKGQIELSWNTINGWWDIAFNPSVPPYEDIGDINNVDECNPEGFYASNVTAPFPNWTVTISGGVTTSTSTSTSTSTTEPPEEECCYEFPDPNIPDPNPPIPFPTTISIFPLLVSTTTPPPNSPLTLNITTSTTTSTTMEPTTTTQTTTPTPTTEICKVACINPGF